MLKLIFEKQNMSVWTGLIQLRIGSSCSVAFSCEHDDKPLDSIKDELLIGQLN
jgi:hypothetical protein